MAGRPTAIEYLTTTRIGEKGRLTVPKEFRDDLASDWVRPLQYCGLAMDSSCCPSNSVSSGCATGCSRFERGRSEDRGRAAKIAGGARTGICAARQAVEPSPSP